MKEFIRKQKPVTAIQFNGHNHYQIMDFLGYEYAGSPKDWEGENILVNTINGNTTCSPSDYVVREALDDGHTLYHVYNREAFRAIFEPI